MEFEENIFIKKIGGEIGFLLGFLTFSSILYLVLNLLDRIPLSVEYEHIIISVFVIYIIRLAYKMILRK